MGQVTAPYGVRGWIRVRTYTEASDGLARYPLWWVGGRDGWVQWKLERVVRQGQGFAAKLEGCDDRDAAAGLARLDIAVPREALPETGADEFYWADLIGLAVQNIEGEALGNVTAIIATGSNDVLVVRGNRERLIPFVKPVIVEVDTAGGRVTVDWGSDY